MKIHLDNRRDGNQLHVEDSETGYSLGLKVIKQLRRDYSQVDLKRTRTLFKIPTFCESILLKLLTENSGSLERQNLIHRTWYG